MAVSKRSARRPARPSKTTTKKKAAARPAGKSAPKKAAPAEDVVYTDVRREMRARLLARFL